MGRSPRGFTEGGPNALALKGILRRDIRRSVDTASGLAEGVPLRLRLTLVNSRYGCGPLEGFAVYAWHCDREGRYSMYSAGLEHENHLRGLQVSDRQGVVMFDTIFPGCYDGRMPHVHFEVFRSLETAGSARQKLRTSQLAFPVEACRQLYRDNPGYGDSIANFERISFERDNVFSDGVASQMTTLSTRPTGGLMASLTVGIDG